MILFDFQSRYAKILSPSKPEQYFTTPVPMGTLEFNEFLKDNLVDINTVTSPDTNTNQNEDVLLAKKKLYIPSSKAKSKMIESVLRGLNKKNMPVNTIKVKDEFDTTNEFQMLENLEDNLRNDYYDVKIQRKRMEDEYANENSAHNVDYAVNQKVLEDFKRKLKLFEKEKEMDANLSNSGDIDITVIDLTPDSPAKQSTIAKLSESPDGEFNNRITFFIAEPKTMKILNNQNKLSSNRQTPDETPYKMHNNLLYGPGKNIYSQIERLDFTGRSNPDRFSKMFAADTLTDKVDNKPQLMKENTFSEMTSDKKDKEFGQDMTIFTPDTKQTELPEFHVSKADGPSKSITISGENYKYTVMYKTSDDTTQMPNNSKY